MQDYGCCIQQAKEVLKSQLFNLLKSMPKDYHNITTLRKIVEELFSDILYLSATDTQKPQVLLADAFHQIERRLNRLSAKTLENTVK